MSKADELKAKNENLFERNTILLNENERLSNQLAQANKLLSDVYKIAMEDWNDPKWHDQVLREAREYLKENE